MNKTNLWVRIQKAEKETRLSMWIVLLLPIALSLSRSLSLCVACFVCPSAHVPLLLPLVYNSVFVKSTITTIAIRVGVNKVSWTL